MRLVSYMYAVMRFYYLLLRESKGETVCTDVLFYNPKYSQLPKAHFLLPHQRLNLAESLANGGEALLELLPVNARMGDSINHLHALLAQLRAR